jgi:drug/metabolite transporter (DMT)-like permease
MVRESSVPARKLHAREWDVSVLALRALDGAHGRMVDSAKASAPAENVPAGIALIVSAFFCASVMSAFGKAATGVPALQLLFLQYGISFLVFLPSVAREGLGSLRTDHAGLHVFRSITGSVCQLLFFISVKSIPLMDAVLLSNAAPLFIPLVVYVWFRKTVQPLVWLSLLIGLVGIVLIIKPNADMFRNPAALIALSAAVFSALALVATNKLAATEPPMRILVYNFGVSTLLLAPLCAFSWQPPTPHEWLLLLGVGVTMALTQYLIILAYRHASAAAISPFNYTVVIFSGLLGWILFGNVPDWVSILGTLLICAGGILSIRAGHPEGRGHALGPVHWFHRSPT